MGDDDSQMLATEPRDDEVAGAVSRAHDEFVGMMSHELRTPLNAIIGWTELLREGHLDAAQTAQALESISRNATAQLVLVEEIVDISRIATGKLTLRETPTNLTRVVHDVGESLRARAAAKGVSMELTLDSGEEELWVDRRRMQQVVSSLLRNSIEFTPAGGHVSVHTERTGATFVLRVQDDGEGMSKQLVAHVFDRFRQGDSSITRAHRGLGLGLAIVRHVVRLHGGDVRAASPGARGGSTFTVSIPIHTTRPPR